MPTTGPAAMELSSGVGMKNALTAPQAPSSIADPNVEAFIDHGLQGGLVSAVEQQALVVTLVPVLLSQLSLPQRKAVPQHPVLDALYTLDALPPVAKQCQ